MSLRVALPRLVAGVFLALALARCPAALGQGYDLLDHAAVQARVGDPGWILVDARDSNAFNGWPWDGEARGGHIPGAANVALAWVEQGRKGVQERLAARGILGDKQLLVYGSNQQQAARLADLLVEKYGVARARLHLAKDGFPAWSAAGLPVEGLKRYDRLVPARWLAEALKAQPRLRVFEVSWGEGEDYVKSHIPKSAHINTDLFESPPIWDLVPPEQLARALATLGIRHDTPVVLYGANPMPAAFAAAVMLYAGVEDVRVLNGGFPAWTAAGLPVESGNNPPRPVADFGAKVPAHPGIFTGIETARQILASPRKILVDVRSWKEYLGEVTGYDDIKAKGRIPGAVWGRSGSDALHMEDYRNPDDTLRDYHDIARFWAEAGITPDRELVAFHCGTGWRASETYLAAWLMDWKNITIYDGGWYEWSADPNNPVTHGEPLKAAQADPRPKANPAPAQPGSPSPFYYVTPLLVLLALGLLWRARRRTA